MVSVNMIVVGGHLGADPEVKMSAQGKARCSFRLATNRWLAKAQTEEVDWHTIVAFEGLAERCQKMLRKGSPVLVEGRLQSSAWNAPDGKRQVRWEVVATRVTFLGQARRDRGAGAGEGGGPEVGGSARRSAESGFTEDVIPF